MKKMGTIAGGIVLGLLILGAGCADQIADEPGIKDADQPTTASPIKTGTSTDDVSITPPAETSPVDNGLAIITLEGEAAASGKVNFTWNTAEKLNESNRLILIRSDKENPEHTGKNNWYRLYYSKKDAVWGDQPTGTWHYRICITEKSSNDSCVFYSNNVQVEVK